MGIKERKMAISNEWDGPSYLIGARSGSCFLRESARIKSALVGGIKRRLREF